MPLRGDFQDDILRGEIMLSRSTNIFDDGTRRLCSRFFFLWKTKVDGYATVFVILPAP